MICPGNYEVFYVGQKEFPVLNYRTDVARNRRLQKRIQIKIANLLKDYPQVSFVTATGEVTDKIVKRTKKFDLLVMAHHNPTGLFSKSETFYFFSIEMIPIENSTVQPYRAKKHFRIAYHKKTICRQKFTIYNCSV